MYSKDKSKVKIWEKGLIVEKIRDVYIGLIVYKEDQNMH